MFLPQCTSGSVTPRVVNTTFQAATPSGAPTHTIATYKPHCPTARQGVVGQTFRVKCPSGAVTPVSTAFQPASPTGGKTP
jgi:hypothetical protein